MIKKYAMIIAVLLVILMFTSTSSASFLFSEGKIYERLPENSPLKNILDRFSQIASDRKDSMSIDINDEDYDVEYDDGNDAEYDNGEHDDDDSEDGLKEDVLLPKIWEVGFYWTPDDGNDEASSGDGTIDYPDGEANNEMMTIDEGDESLELWTVEAKPMTVKLERFVKIVTELNENLGAMLERVIERTVATDENGISSPGSGGSAENNQVDVVVLTNGDQ